MLGRERAEREQGDAALSARQREVRLVVRVADGDAAAFETLYRTFHPRLWRFLERMMRRPHLVEEVLDDTMLVVWRKADTFDMTCAVSTWIFAIAFRKALKALKGLDDPVDANADDFAATDGRGPESTLLRQEVRALLRRALGALSAEQRAVVELTYYHGCDYREIATIMDCPVDTVKTRMFHARRKLRTLLAAHESELN